MTNQEIFDKVWTHFVVEGEPQSLRSTEGVAECQYRGEDGARCAVGVLIPDELYTQSLEGLMVSAFTEEGHPELYQHLSLEDGGRFDLLCRLQNIHDTYFDDFRGKMIDLAEKEGLRVP